MDRALSTTRGGAVNIRHTEKGRAVARDLWRRMFDAIGAFVDGWTEEELSEGERLLSKLRLGQAAGDRSSRSWMPAHRSGEDEVEGS